MNTNCLENLACPKCGQADELLVNVSIWTSLRDDGTDHYANSTKLRGDVEYDETALAACPGCGFEGTLKDFEIAAVDNPAVPADAV